MPWCRLRAWRHLGKKQAGLGNRFMEIRVFGRVDDVDAARDDRDGAAGEGAVMRRRVDPARQPRDDDIALAAEVLGQRLRKPLRVD